MSLQIGKYAGIPVKVHWTFALFLMFVVGFGIFNGVYGTDLIWFLGFIMAMFLCVILHEFGHALMARKYGVKTLDIIISPIGGLARLERLPKKPIQELKVALAGPLVNLIISILLLLIMRLYYGDFHFLVIVDDIKILATPKGFFSILIWTNAILMLFNLIPAFPMDGGRVLRSLLSMKLGRVKATHIASWIGRILAIIFMMTGFYFAQYIWIFLGGFIFLMARAENQQVLVESILKKAIAGEIMNRSFSKYHLSDSVGDIFQKYLSSNEKTFLVFDSLDNLSGVIPESYLKEAFNKDLLDSKSANEIMINKILEIEESMPLDELFRKMNKKATSVSVIKNGDQILGVIDRHMLQKYIQLYLYK